PNSCEQQGSRIYSVRCFMTDRDASKLLHGMPQGPRPFRPETLGEARQLIQKTFDRQRWDERSQRFYLNNLGLQPRPVAELDLDVCRLVLARMERSRMIIFAEEIAGTYCRP